MDARTLAEQIIRKIGDAATELIIVRNGLENESLAENGMGSTVADVKEDLFNVLMAHDTGCIDPEDLNAENCEVMWLESKLGEFREQQWIKITDDPQFLRRWYEQLKADDPHHCAEHDGEHGDDFSTYGEYTFELFRESRIVKAGLKAISPTWVRIDGPNSLPPDEQFYEFIVGPNIVGIGLCRKGQWMVPDPHEETDFREVHGVRYWREIGPLPAPPEEHQ